MPRRTLAVRTPDGRIEHFVRTLATDVPQPPAGTSHALPVHWMKLKLRTIRRECGLRRLDESHFVHLARLLKGAGIHVQPSLVPGIGLDEWVRFSRTPFREAPLTFDAEDALKVLLAKAIRVGSSGPLGNLRLIGEEYRLNSARRVDFLCEVRSGPDRGTLVVIEAKRHTDQRTAEQMTTYLIDLKEEPRARGRKVKGIVITGDDDAAGRRLVGASGFFVEWFRYDLSFERLNSGHEEPL